MDGILEQIANPRLAEKLLGGYQMGQKIATNRMQMEVAKAKAERDRITNLREDQVGFMESSTRQLMPALEIYQQDPITANRLYTQKLQDIREAYPDYADKLPERITSDNYQQLVGRAQSALMDLDMRRKLLASQMKPAEKAYKPGQLVEIKAGVTGNEKIITTRYTPGEKDYGFGPGMVPISEAGRFRESPMVQIGIGEKEEQKAKVEIAKDDFKAVTQQGDSSQRQLASINQAQALLDDQTFITGRLEPIKMELSAYAESLGMDPTKYGLQRATTPQEFRTVLSGLILGKAQLMKGNLSDKDIKFLWGSEASLANTKEANRLLLAAGNAMASMDVKKAEFYREQFEQGDVSLTQINNNWRKSPYNVPVVGKSPEGKPVFWTQYFNTMLEANSNNPEYFNKETNTLDTTKLLQDISKKWKESYAIK